MTVHKWDSQLIVTEFNDRYRLAKKKVDNSIGQLIKPTTTIDTDNKIYGVLNFNNFTKFSVYNHYTTQMTNSVTCHQWNTTFPHISF